ncbi:MAG: sugar-binding domain-containing protein, partial [Planctomycetota bacterium]
MKTSLSPVVRCFLWFFLVPLSISTQLGAQETRQASPPGQDYEGLNRSSVDQDSVRALGFFPKDAEGFLPERIHDRWEFRPDGQTSWEPVSLPSTFESHKGVGFDGVGWYRKRFPRIRSNDSDLRSKRLILRFHGVATQATLWCDGKLVAEHLGGWTPFECDITDFILRPGSGKPAPEGSAAEESPGASQDCEVLLKVDELVGHNSQGFLPVFAPHFGGIWKPIEAL